MIVSGETTNGVNVAIKPLRKKEGINVPNVTLVKMERGLRGKGNKDKKVTFEGIDDSAARPDNPLDAALQLVQGDVQAFWDRFTLGYNEFAYDTIADPIAVFINSSWDADKVKNFRNSVNALSKLTGKDREDVAEELVKQMG